MKKDILNKSEFEDILDEPFKGVVNYQFCVVPELESARVSCPPLWTMGKGSMKYFEEFGKDFEIVQEEHLKSCCFAPNISKMDAENPQTVKVPEDLYSNEFLNLNPLNIEELLCFQRKYGRIYGARANKHFYYTNLKEHMRPEPDGHVFSGQWAKLHANQFEGIRASAVIFDSIPNEEDIDELDACKYGAVSFQECIATVLDTQRIIKDTLRVLRDDMPKITVREAIDAGDSVEWLAALLPNRMPIVNLVVNGKAPKDKILGLMDVIHLQLVRGLLNNNAYRTCQNPECQRLFTPIEMRRRLDTKYCSMECQERAKRLRYIAKHSKKGTLK